jgi:hypothetical protein
MNSNGFTRRKFVHLGPAAAGAFLIAQRIGYSQALGQPDIQLDYSPDLGSLDVLKFIADEKTFSRT